MSRAEDSKQYLEGTVSVENRMYTLTDIRYFGTSSKTGTLARGVMDGTEVLYRFENFTGYGAGVKQWLQRRGGTAWQVNSEYNALNTVTTETEYRSAVVYLALDASSSLKPTDVDAVRNAVKQFIKTLYEKSRGVILSQTFLEQGIMSAGRKDYDAAIKDFTEAIRLNSKSEAAYYNRGNAYFDKGDFDQTIADYDQAISLDPNYALAYNNRGSAYWYKEDYTKCSLTRITRQPGITLMHLGIAEDREISRFRMKAVATPSVLR